MLSVLSSKLYGNVYHNSLRRTYEGFTVHRVRNAALECLSKISKRSYGRFENINIVKHVLNNIYWVALRSNFYQRIWRSTFLDKPSLVRYLLTKIRESH